MKELRLPADLPLTLVTTAVRADPFRPDRFLLDLHSPSQDVRIRFPDESVLLACRRALTGLINDARRLPPESLAGRLYHLDDTSDRIWKLSGHL